MRTLLPSRWAHSIVFAWLSCLLAALFYTFEYLLRIEPGVMVKELQSHFSISAGGLGLLASMYYWGYTPLQLIVGLATDYFGARKVLITAILLCTVGVFLFGYTQLIVVAAIARLMVGIGSAFAFVGALKLGADWLPRRYFSFFVGLCTSLGMLGAMFGETAMSWVVVHLGWHPVITISVWLGLALIGVFFLFVYEKHEMLGESHRAAPLDLKTLLSALMDVARSRRILKASIVGCAMYLSLSLIAEQWGNLYIQKVIHGNAEQASYFVDMIFLGWFIGSPLSGYLSERLKSRKKPLQVGCIVAFLTIIPVIAIPTLLPHWVLALLLFLYGLFCSAEINCFAVARDLVNTRMAATAVGFMNTIVMVSGMIIQPLFAYSLDALSYVTRQGPLPAHTVPLVNFQAALIVVPLFLFISSWLVYTLQGSYGAGTRGGRRKRLEI